MKTYPLALLLSANLAGALPSIAADLEPEFPGPGNSLVAHDSGQVREFRVTLLDEQDKPVAGVPVELYGMRRGSRWPGRDDTDQRSTNPWWTFTTDGKGQLLARFAVSEKPWDHAVPREGRFFFVVDLPDGRRAVSSPIFHGITRADALGEKENEWDDHLNHERIFAEEEGDITMHLVKGRTITGTVVTPDGKPLQGRLISADHDLHIESRTGAGGEIFTVSATSDAEGRFKLEHVYPAACSLTMEGEGHWSRTQVALHSADGTTTRWVGGFITLPEMPLETAVDLRIEVAPKAPTYRYFGTVADPTGKPQAGLHVIAGISHNPAPETWGDSHRFQSATTDASGRWEIHAESPWVRFFDVRRTEFGDSLIKGEDYESDGLGLAAPGEYHLKVKAAGMATKGP